MATRVSYSHRFAPLAGSALTVREFFLSCKTWAITITSGVDPGGPGGRVGQKGFLANPQRTLEETMEDLRSKTNFIGKETVWPVFFCES